MSEIAPLAFVTDAIRLIRAALPPQHPVDRIRGSTFHAGVLRDRRGRLASLRAGQSVHVSRPRPLARAPGAAGRATALYLNAQVAAGAQALQIFDSWVGTLGPHDYARFVQPHMASLFAKLDPDVPVIHFGTGTATLLELQRDAGGAVIGLDWRVELDAAWRAAWRGRGRAGQPRSGGVAGFARRDRAIRRAGFLRRRPVGPATSSTWGTESCRRRRSTTCATWSTWCTSSAGDSAACRKNLVPCHVASHDVDHFNRGFSARRRRNFARDAS